jgi:hypothetical protein
MLKNFRAWALALATFSLAQAANAACPTLSLTGLTGQNATQQTETLATITQSSQQLPLHVDNVFNGSSYLPLVSDANCFLDVDIQAGSVSVSNFPATQPVSAASLPLPAGAATSANQPALNGDGGGLAHVTNFPATQPVSATALPLPTGAATSANQTAAQSSPGTSATTAVTVQGSASGVAIPVNCTSGCSGGGGGGSVYGPTAVGSAAANPPVLIGGTSNGAATGNVGVLEIISGIAQVNATQSGTWNVGITGTPTVNLGTLNGAATATNQTAVQSAPGTSAGTAVTVQGSASGVGLPVTQSLSATGGWTPKLLNGLSTTVVQIKASAGQLALVQCYNPNTSQIYVQLLDSASPTLGTTTPVASIPVAPGSTGGFTLSGVGVQFANAIQVAATTTATGSTAPTTAPDCNAVFK